MDSKTPATVISGFLGVGKTTLIRHLLERSSGKRIALIVAAFQGCSDQAARRLVLLDNAEKLQNLAALPGNRLEMLRGDRAGRHSIRINA